MSCGSTLGTGIHFIPRAVILCTGAALLHDCVFGPRQEPDILGLSLGGSPMKKSVACAFVVAVATSFAAAAAMQDGEPIWAWGFTSPPDPNAPAPTVASVQ